MCVCVVGGIGAAWQWRLIHVYAHVHWSTLCICKWYSVYVFVRVKAHVPHSVCLLVISTMCVSCWKRWCWWIINIWLCCKISRGYKQVIYWPLMFVFTFGSEDTHTVHTSNNNLMLHYTHLLHHWLPDNTSADAVCVPIMHRGHRRHPEVSVCGSKQTLFLTLNFTHCYIRAGACCPWNNKWAFRLTKMDYSIDQRLLL